MPVSPAHPQPRSPKPLDLFRFMPHAIIVAVQNLLFKNFPRGILAVRGKDRVSFLHNVVSHDIKGLTSGQARQACLLDRQGKIQFWALVHARPEELLLEMAPEAAAGARTALERYLISEDVRIEEASARYRVTALHGPAAPDLLLRAGIAPISRWDILGMPGFHLPAEASEAEELSGRLLSAGGPLGLVAAGMETFETLRIEAGAPWPGKEIGPDVILNELGREDLVSFTKGCYVGQEIVARIKHRAHPPRLLTGFRLEGKEAPPVPSEIRQEDQLVGTLTSACFSPALGAVIGLGFLKHGTPGTGLQVQTPAGAVPAHPAPLPFKAPLA